MKLANVTANDLQAKLFLHVEPGSTVMTDEYRGYRGIDRMYHHETVLHAVGEYARDRIHTNSIEGAWSLFKRQVYGIHHWISEKQPTGIYRNSRGGIIAATRTRASASINCWIRLAAGSSTRI
jgi:hypothetical protein